MNPSLLQQWIDEVLESSLQQWLLRTVALLMPFAALLAAAGANERWWPAGFFIVGILGAAAAMRPDTHAALVVVIAIVWHWLATVDGTGGWWLLGAALCLLVYHGVIAISASLPTGGDLPLSTIGGWLVRTATVGVIATIVWGFVVVLDRRDAPGNGLLTGLALAVIAIAAVLIRNRSVGRPG